ncbi:MAG: RNA polymerase sigma factor [Lewinella sp.]|uniref:RNA polymerase sigma factor n=1 Tax=Lewinella sp. TaxID=2004506 RepID=UPI003D6A9C3D
MANSTAKSAFLQWYEPHHQKLVRYCSSKAFGVMSAEDLVQEAILATLANWEKIKDRDKLLGYMIGVVNNLVRNHRRRAPFRGQWDEQQLNALESRLGDAATALDISFLLKAIDQLPKKQAEALQLFEISGFKIKEIAALQQSTEGAIKTSLSRARQHLRKTLAEDGRRLSVGERLHIYTSILF